MRNDECNSCNINPCKNDECNSCNITVKKQNNAAYVYYVKKLIDCKSNTCNENRSSETSMLRIFYNNSENQIKKRESNKTNLIFIHSHLLLSSFDYPYFFK